MTKLAFELGRYMAKQAGPASIVGKGVGHGVDALLSALGYAAKPMGKAYAHQLGHNPLSTLGITGLGAGALGEGISALGQRLGLSSPTGNSHYAPHLSAARFNPHVSGWSSLLQAYTKPVQFAKHLMQGSKMPEGAELAQNYNPTTKLIEGGSKAYSTTRDGRLQEVITHDQNKPLFDLFSKARKAVGDLPQANTKLDIAPVAPEIKPPRPAATSPSRFSAPDIVQNTNKPGFTDFL